MPVALELGLEQGQVGERKSPTVSDLKERFDKLTRTERVELLALQRAANLAAYDKQLFEMSEAEREAVASEMERLTSFEGLQSFVSMRFGVESAAFLRDQIRAHYGNLGQSNIETLDFSVRERLLGWVNQSERALFGQPLRVVSEEGGIHHWSRLTRSGNPRGFGSYAAKKKPR